MLEAHVITLFPDMFESFLSCSFVERAQKKQAMSVILHNLRDFTHDKHNSVDDEPFGGGPGMVLMPGPIFEAAESISESPDVESVVLMTPQGALLTQDRAAEFAQKKRIIVICGRYEGVDERVREYLVTDEVSIGDYVLAGGELPAMVFLEAISRLVPGVVGCEESTFDESHSFAMLEYPQYTRPAKFRSWKVPKVLVSGDHEGVRRWRARQSLLRTFLRRPDLLCGVQKDGFREEMRIRLTLALGDN
ncbi:tRNA (guanosine(37)-N1)-methyltransferase TrmD [bacterium]|nr:tRNA (guanosine(37)-N1)-methyltransferase TrmD [bacterium]